MGEKAISELKSARVSLSKAISSITAAKNCDCVDSDHEMALVILKGLALHLDGEIDYVIGSMRFRGKKEPRHE